MEKILVTGSAGFIGTHLVPQIINQNYKVIGICKRKQKSFKNFISISNDICTIKNSDLKHNFSKIIHMAALSDVKFCDENPTKCYNTNVNGTKNILEIARKRDVPVIFLSSSHVYGIPKKLPLYENDDLNPTSIYGSSKIIGETLCETYSRIYGLDISVLRLFSVYGPKSPKSNLIFNIIDQILNSDKIRIGNVKPKRDFIYVDDVIRSLLLVTNSIKRGYNVYNLGTEKSTSISLICKMLEKISKKNLNILSIKDKQRRIDVPEIRCSNSKIKLEFGWYPRISLSQGLKKTYEYYFNY